MQQINKYIVTDLGTQKVSIFSDQDSELISSYQLNNVSFDPKKHDLDLRVYDFDGNLLETFYGVSDYSVEGTTLSGGPTHLVVDPVTALEDRGYLGDTIVEYSATNNLFSSTKESNSLAELFVSEISSDRTEIRARSTTLSDVSLKSFTNNLYERFNSKAYFSEAYLRFQNYDVDITCINVMTEVVDGIFYVTFKLYEALPTSVKLRDKFTVVEKIGEPVRYKVVREVEVVEDKSPRLQGPNFEIDVQQQSANSTSYYSYEQLFSYPGNNSRNELYSIFKQSGAEIGVDFSKFSNFINFSSAEERLENFRYKLELIYSYQKEIDDRSKRNYVDPDIQTYEDLKQGVISNFDPYERFLYFENSSRSWPKINGSRPYVNADPAESYVEDTKVGTWWNDIVSEAQEYDKNNINALVNSVPEKIRENLDNAAYTAFVNMVGQHLDEQWLYAKAISDRYSGDNRLDFGISKDLVKEALKSFGLTLQETDQNLTELFDLCKPSGEYDKGIEKSVNRFKQISVAAAMHSTTYDGKEAGSVARYVVDGEYASHSGSIEGHVEGLVGTYVSGSIFGSVKGTGRGTLKGNYNGVDYPTLFLSGSIEGSLSGSFVGTISGSVDLETKAFFSGSFFEGTVVDGGIADNSYSGDDGSVDLQPLSVENYRKEVYKRIYHNIPYLLKTKGTDRGLKALIACFGIPDDILEVSLHNRLQEDTVSAKNRISIVEAEGAPIVSEEGNFEDRNILSQNTSTEKPGFKGKETTNEVHIGFNLNKQANIVIRDWLKQEGLTLDDLIGNPGNLGENYEKSLSNIFTLFLAENRESLKLLRSPAAIIRLVRYVDSCLYRAVQDFVPARAEVQTGVIVEDNLLHRNKYNKALPEASKEKDYLGEIKTAFIEGSDGKSLEYASAGKYEPSWIDDGDVQIESSKKYTGELQGSTLEITDGEIIKNNVWNGKLVKGNPFKYANSLEGKYSVGFRFLSLPGNPSCSISTLPQYEGKTFSVYSTEGTSISCFETLPETNYDGGNTSTSSSSILDGGTTTSTGTVTIDANNWEGREYTLGSEGYVIVPYVSGSFTNQIKLTANSQRGTFVGWYEGIYTSSTEMPKSVFTLYTSEKQFTLGSSMTSWSDEEGYQDNIRVSAVTSELGFGEWLTPSINIESEDTIFIGFLGQGMTLELEEAVEDIKVAVRIDGNLHIVDLKSIKGSGTTIKLGYKFRGVETYGIYEITFTDGERYRSFRYDEHLKYLPVGYTDETTGKHYSYICRIPWYTE